MPWWQWGLFIAPMTALPAWAIREVVLYSDWAPRRPRWGDLIPAAKTAAVLTFVAFLLIYTPLGAIYSWMSGTYDSGGYP